MCEPSEDLKCDFMVFIGIIINNLKSIFLRKDMKKRVLLISLILLSIFLVSFISAFSFNDFYGKITGKVVEGCVDSDGGVNPFVNGICEDSRGLMIEDACINTGGVKVQDGNYVKEAFCLTLEMREYCKNFSSPEYCDGLPDDCYSIGLAPWAFYSYFEENESWYCSPSCSDGACIGEGTGECVPDCTGKQCGYDSCGIGTCGTCGVGEECDGYGQCVSVCTPGELCYLIHSCRDNTCIGDTCTDELGNIYPGNAAPNCANIECGLAPNGCGLCENRCDSGEICVSNFCQNQPPNVTEVVIFPNNLPPGTLFTITANITDIDGISVENHPFAEIGLSDGSIDTLILFDDGNHGDLDPGDEIYGNVWDSTNYAVGYYNVNIIAEDQLGNSKKYEDITQILLSGNNCIEVTKNGDPADKIDVVFVPDGYTEEDLVQFSNQVNDHIDLVGKMDGIISREPFTSNADKFNFYLINQPSINICSEVSLSADGRPLCDPRDALPYVSTCPGYDQIINLVKRSDFFRPFAFFPMTGVGYALSKPENPKITSHEFGHSFGNLVDQYLPLSYPSGDTPFLETLACDSVGCPRWCEGDPVSLDILKNFDCSLYENPTTRSKLTNHPCAFSGELVLNITDLSCNSKKNPSEMTPEEKDAAEIDPCYFLEIINLVNYCDSLSEIDCIPTSTNFKCAWRNRESTDPDQYDPYFQSRCIPLHINLTIGTNCMEGTGCYPGCGSISLWRPTYDGSIMMRDVTNKEFDPVEREHLLNLLNQYS